MRNLILKYCQQFDPIVSNAKLMLISSDHNKTDHENYIIADDKLYAFRAGNPDSIKVIAEVPNILAAEYLVLDKTICLATSVGEVLLVYPQTLTIKEGTFCNVGIEYMAWSPDQEVVVFVTRDLHVVIMSCTFDPINEHILRDTTLKVENQFVNVGWGKKQTQFHGKEGKQAANEKLDPTNIEGLPQIVELSWRGDGTYFVVSYVCLNEGRTFKVFDKEGKLYYKAEKQLNLFPSVAWRPSGNWVAMPQKLPNKSTIALFEKNGLRHRELVLPFDLEKEAIVSLKWNSNSDILSIQTVSSLYLYTIGNYHWYLKKVLTFKEENSVKHFYWDKRIGEENLLHVLLSNGRYLVYKWHWAIQGYMPIGLALVIDGKSLLCTNFSKSVIPPPMCACELQLETKNYISMIDIEMFDSELYLIVYDSDHQLHLYKTSLAEPLPFLKAACTLNGISMQLSQNLSLSSMRWLDKKRLITAFTKNNNTYLKVYDLNDMDKNPISIITITGTIAALDKSSKNHKRWFYQILETKKITSVDIYEPNKYSDEFQLDHIIDELEVIDTNSTILTIALTSHQCLYVNTNCVATDVTSFYLVDNYIAFTKLASLHFLRLDNLCIINERCVERGAKLLTVISQSARTVLQIPRGNLELIYPRVLSLKLVGDLLDAKCYEKAFDILRKQRINLNIMCDHNVSEFMENLDKLFQEIQNPNWLNLFINDLKNEDYTKTMYASNYPVKSKLYPKDFTFEEKIPYVCKALLSYMTQSTEKRFRLPIITAYVKLGYLEKALELIWKERKHDSIEADNLLKYLLYLVDVNELYNVALGTYDFSLVLFVTQKSQKDPKEILRFLNELKAYDNNYRKFKIDEHLKRYERALLNIANCGPEKFDEALTFVKQHQCFKFALKAYENHPDCYRSICLAFADYLRANGKLEEASLMYERGGNSMQAFLSAKHILDWQRVLILAIKSQQNITDVAKSIAMPLQEQGKYGEAFELLKQYGGDFKEALQCLIEGKLFLRAIFEMERNGVSGNLLKSFIEEQLQEHCKQLLDTLMTDNELFNDYKQRLLDVRANRLKKTCIDDVADETKEMMDNGESDTSSLHSSTHFTATSRSSGKTFRSSKNRRKHERKILSLKPGNVFEEIALVDALHNQVTKCVNQQQHIRDTCKACLMLHLDAEANELQQHFKQLIKLLQNSLDEIWIPEMMVTGEFLQGPSIDYMQLQNEQRYALLNPLKRFKPQMNIFDWSFDLIL